MRAPVRERFVNFNVKRICSSDSFCYTEKLIGETYNFKIDTGSDVFIFSVKLLGKEIGKRLEMNSVLRYPTGERVPIKSKIMVKVELGKYSIQMPMFAAVMKDDCLFGSIFSGRQI